MAVKHIHIKLQSKGGRGPIACLVVQADENAVRMMLRRRRLSHLGGDVDQGSLAADLARIICFSINEDAEVVHAFEARQGGGDHGH